MSVRIIYETHATTTDNERGAATGWLPGELSEAGRAQAIQLGRRRANSAADALYVSDLQRAVQTAEIAFAGVSVPVILDTRLRECNYGEWNGMPVERLRRERRNHIRTPFPAGESYEQVVARTASFLADLLATRDAQTVMLISHSANRWALDHLIHGIPLEDLVDADFDWRPGWEYVLTSEALEGAVSRALDGLLHRP